MAAISARDERQVVKWKAIILRRLVSFMTDEQLFYLRYHVEELPDLRTIEASLQTKWLPIPTRKQFGIVRSFTFQELSTTQGDGLISHRLRESLEMLEEAILLNGFPEQGNDPTGGQEKTGPGQAG
jgi:hypothetical protein